MKPAVHFGTSLVSGIAGGYLGWQLWLAATAQTPAIPDPHFTPGAIDATATTLQICEPGYSRAHRMPRGSAEYDRWLAVMRAYRIPAAERHNYELDHLVPLCLGGADVTENLWPQKWSEAREKDDIERRACRASCDPAADPRLMGGLQRQFELDWRGVEALLPR